MNHTSIEQSKRLVDLGLDPNTADMVHYGIHKGIDGNYHLSGTNTNDDVIPIDKALCSKTFEKVTKSDIECKLPCWSVSALMDLLPEIRINYHLYKWRYSLESLDYIEVSSGKILHSITSNGVLNKFYDMVVWLLEDNYI